MSSMESGSPHNVLLRLFITGNSQRSLRAVEAVQGMCKEFLSNGVQLEIVDVLEKPEQAESAKILATPTLIRQEPSPPRRLVGDLCEAERLVQLLGLKDYIRPRDNK